MHIKKLVFVQIEFRFVFVADATRYVSLFFFQKNSIGKTNILRLHKDFEPIISCKKTSTKLHRIHKRKMAICVGFFMYLRSGKLRKLRRFYSYLTQVETDPHQIAFIHMAGRVSK